ncbi:MAG: hypothetical protein EZS28_045288 [Streblomastix strix]|uniref:B30.2/SPRY domain-containing protein n=1 Tax=Streblomastix strix TaxID=222440 RepID=A0A5J4TP01_9EUKA|nr:MAG: hypothetical protein EZS28_045288 [Streblomastix strix]
MWGLYGVGIADQSVRFGEDGRDAWPYNVGKGRIVEYRWSGGLYHSGDVIVGNSEFAKGHRVCIELNMDSNPRTVTFFYDDKEQENYVANIPEAVRFWTFFHQKGAQFKILKFERVYEAYAQHRTGFRALTFGQDWKQ